MTIIAIASMSTEQTVALGRRIGAVLRGGEVIQLISDVGGGKTTFVKGLAAGMGSAETVQSPTFVISAVYDCSNGKQLYHYDFYRLDDPGLMREQLIESLNNQMAVTVIEWGEIVQDVIRKDVISIHIRASGENDRRLELFVPAQYDYLKKALKEFV